MNAETKPRIGFIGIGLMGHGMAKNLVAKGYPLTVRVHRNRKPLEDLVAAGAKEVSTDAELAHASDIVFLCVTGTPQVEEIVYGTTGLLSAARDGLIVVDTSTAEPASTAKMRKDFDAKHALFVDAPLARTPVEAEQGRLNTMVGADDAVFARLRPVLSAFCENVIHAGPPGSGHTLKLINNFIAMTIATATAEACAAAVKSGLLDGNGDLTGLKFALSNAMKDLRYYTHLAEGLPVPAIVGEAVHQSLVTANLLGLGDKYVASLVEAQERLAGVKIVPRA